ncbi:unnamed protein product [Schistosoma intercalatum]|nr:unnamed protein product [Schistosoma intercalatum]
MVDLRCPDYMNYLCRVHSLQGETNNHKKEKIDPNSISGEMAELSDYTIEALESFKRKLTTYIEAVDKSLASAAEESLNFDFHEKLPSGTY